MTVKTRISSTLSIAVLLLIASTSFAQTSAASSRTASRSWTAFWREFSVAIQKKDVAALTKMMPDDFFDGGGGLTAKEWLQFINENEKNGSWRDIQKSVARGTVTSKKLNSKNVPTRVTRDNAYYFEFRKDKRWYFAGVVGD